MYYFCSKEKFESGTILKPRIPVYLIKNEDCTTKRICCSTSIDGCLSSINNFNQNDQVHVYTIEPLFENHIIYPSENQVMDAPITGEAWITCDAQLQYYGTLEIFDIFPREIDLRFVDSYSYEFI